MPHHTDSGTGVQAFVDAHPLNRYHFLVFGLCMLGLLLDGFDAQAMGYVAPALKAQFGLSANDLGRIFSASLAGMLIGAVSLGTLADRIGRRPIVVGALSFCGLAMCATAAVHTVTQLIALRFVTGIALGTLMPTILALASEFSPSRSRPTVIMLVSTGFIIGAATGGLIAAALIPRFGPAAVFLFGGGGSLVAALLLGRWLPESVQFLARTECEPYPHTVRILRKLGGAAAGVDVTAFVGSVAQKGMHRQHWTALFSGRQRTVTALLWVINFANLLDLYFLSNWLPTLLRDGGLPLASAIAGSTVLQSGGIPGSVLLGVLARRFRIDRVLLLNFMAGTLAIVSIGGTVHMGSPLLFAAIFVAGLCVVGGQSAINALCAHCYAPSIRSTGMGWASGVGRMGSVVGPMVGGLLVTLHWGVQNIIVCAGIAGVASTASVFMLGCVSRMATTGNTAAQAAAH